MRRAAEDLGVGDTFRKTPVGVFFGAAGGAGARPRTSAAPGPTRTGCTQCGNCMVGCRVGAKNTLVKNYLALAERRGVRIEPLRTVTAVRPVDPARPERGYARDDRARPGRGCARTGARSRPARWCWPAGAWGTQRLLHTMRATGVGCRTLSPRLGDLTRTNSEALGGAMTARAPEGVDLTRGVAITSSFHPDADTHVENVPLRPRARNAMGLLGHAARATVAAGCRGRCGSLGAGRRAARSAFARSLSVRRWSERTVIGLVMQSLDNSLTVAPRRGPLGWGRG